MSHAVEAHGTRGAPRPGGIVGVIVNPLAGKDIRRLVSAAGHTSDAVKISILRRVIIAAAEAGARRILLSADPHRLAERAATDLGPDVPVEVIALPLTWSRADTAAAAAHLRREGASVIVALGGDGTARDVALGWHDVPLIAIATGTNNVYPSAIDGTAAGTAAALVATGSILLADVARRSKCIALRSAHPHVCDRALVDVAVIDTAFIGARAVSGAHDIRLVIAAIASPATTGLSSIAGRLSPVGRWEPGGVAVWLGPGGRLVRVPLSPGAFTTVAVREVVRLAFGEPVSCPGPGVVAVDGERDRRLGKDSTITATIEPSGPMLIDVAHTLVLAAAERRFDVSLDTPEVPHVR